MNLPFPRPDVATSVAGQQFSAEVVSPGVPATPDVEASAPCPEPLVSGGHVETSILVCPSVLEPTPASFSLSSVQTPIYEDRPQIDFTIAGALPPTNVSLPSSTIIRTAPNLRLPSFDALGIAAPHPDRMSSRSNSSFSPTALGAGPLSKPEDPLHALSPPLAHRQPVVTAEDPPTTSPRPARAHVEHLVSTFTPPSEPGTFSWGALVRTAGLGSPPSSDPGVSPNLSLTASTGEPPRAPIIVPAPADIDGAVRMAVWIEDVKSIAIKESGCLELTSVKVLSHALPCPSLSGHLFGQLITAIHDRTSATTSWINVFHAVPGRYTLSDLPKSPPSTPGPAVGGEEYFTSKVFDSAVAIPDYQLDSKLLPPSPRPVVPPDSINISIVERYIPPTNSNEFAEMFSLRGRSLLFDRLTELSPDDGVLLFIYPTKTGARTFMQQYLGPIIEPLLRTVTVVHDLHSELGRSLGHMTAVNYLDEYTQLEEHVRSFCSKLENGSTKGNGIDKHSYEVIHAAKEEMYLERSAWADDWWIKQEKSRIRDTVARYFRKSKKLPTGEMTGAHLIQEVLEGVSSREYEDGPPKQGIEVGIFAIKKTRLPSSEKPPMSH